ncbi:cache domain-containing protein [Thiomicrospira microaerophila]|uniref:cache domain-containing protein n=1 Tax=Thiomicrospira microaerophila TaxID=406020 RepID=UPI000696427B|nr:cache domain-containing protein [Thiomicrospira microaerophila]
MPSNISQRQTFLTYLPKVKTYLDQLEEQNMWWTTVAMVGKINSEAFHPQLLASIVETQKEFQHLRDLMIDSLIDSYLGKTESDIKLKTQASVDLIIRNLFERTADVGFLATDADIVEFMALDQPADAQRQRIERRLEAYVAKYSVYDDIVLVKPNGQVMAKLNPNNHTLSSTDPLIRQAINSKQAFEEIHRASDLFPQNTKSLIYAKRIEQKAQNGRPTQLLGVLCLSFKFDQEMALIFKKIGRNSPDYRIALCHESGETLATNHPQTFPIGEQIKQTPLSSKPVNKNNKFCFHTKTKGYEGFQGLPWHIYVELENQAAFCIHETQTDSMIEVKPDSPLYLKQLERTNIKVSTLLLIVILNGKISSLKQNVEYFLPILDRFQDISQDIARIFADFIHHIHQIRVETVRDKVAFSAALAADILDRNLYERANDCRWWALNPLFSQTLTHYHQHKKLDKTQRETLYTELSYINQLYTVYTNILVYDLQGRVLAVSNPDASSLVGQTLSQINDVKHSLQIKDPQQYWVSQFESTPLYNQQPSFIYHAPIKSTDHPNQNVGGIALVFDSATQFHAMLKDSEPHFTLEAIQQGSFSLYVNTQGVVISSTQPDMKPGRVIQLPNRLRQFKPGDAGSLNWTLDQKAYLVGFYMTDGYREYKTQDGYQDEVISLCFTPI